MERLVQTYAQKTGPGPGWQMKTGPHAPLVGGLDDVMVWKPNRRRNKGLGTGFFELEHQFSCLFTTQRPPMPGSSTIWPNKP